MFAFHADKARYFSIQKQITEEEVIPFIEPYKGVLHNGRVLEIGCAEAGVLKAFIDNGNVGVGVELSSSRFDTASINLKEDIAKGRAKLVNQNIYEISNPMEELGGLFSVIVLKDVIEHIPDQKRFIEFLSRFLAPDGIIFFAYPPWWMPFGGHQQICRNRFLQRLPWFHLLPSVIYGWVLKAGGESEATMKELMEVKSTGILIETLKKYIRTSGFKVIAEKYWLINPIYAYKFGIPKKELPAFFSAFPYIRNFYTTAHYILYKKV